MEHVEMERPDGTCSSGVEDGLLRKTQTGKRKGDIWGDFGERAGGFGTFWRGQRLQRGRKIH